MRTKKRTHKAGTKRAEKLEAQDEKAEALNAWKALPVEERKAIRKKWLARKEFFTPTVWYTYRKRAVQDGLDIKGFGKFLGKPKQKTIKAKAGPTLRVASDKALAKEIRAEAKKHPTVKAATSFVALMEPAVIVPDNMAETPIIADAGTVVRLMDQSVLYREWVSPITRRVDERLVQYGNAKKLKMGWITMVPIKPVNGPTFLVTTKNEAACTAWNRLRLLVARARKNDGGMSLGPWLATHGDHAEHQPLIREVTREFGGKTVKNEPYETRFNRLCNLILHTELDMATSKRSKTAKKAKKGTAKTAKVKNTKTTKPTKDKATKSKKASEFSPRSRDFDQHVIRRLIKENPRRAGSNKAKIWAKLHKGMTVEQFVKKGGSRGAVGKYIANGWAKLLPPSSTASAEE